MVDSVKGLTVIFESNIREDDCEYIINAIRMIRGVNSVEKHMVNLSSDYFIEKRTIDKIRNKLVDTLHDLYNNKEHL